MTRFTNPEAEEALIGILLFDDTRMTQIQVALQAEHFSDPLFGYIFSVIKEQQTGGKVADAITVHRRIVDTEGAPVKVFEEAGGIAYLGTLVDRANMQASIASYAAEIVDCWKMRHLQNAFANSGGIQKPEDMLAHIRSVVTEVDAFTDDGDDFEDLQTIAERRITMLTKFVDEKREPGLKTGLACFDRLGGLNPSTQFVIGGRPGMAKTALLRNALAGAAMLNPDHDFVFFSIEMSKYQGVDRSLSAATLGGDNFMMKPTQYRALKRPTIEMISDLAAVRHQLPSNVFVSSRSRLSISAVRRGLTRLRAKRKRPIGAFGIDYLQLMDFEIQRNETLAAAIGRTTSESKSIAKDLDCAAILLSQLARRVEERENKRPNMSDLKDSGSLEQDADYILFPFRPHYYEKAAGPKKTEIQDEYEDRMKKIEHDMFVDIAKARDDWTGDVPMFCDMGFDVIRNLS